MSMPPLSEKVQTLIKKARIVSFVTWQETHPAEALQIFQSADDERQYLTNEALSQIERLVPGTALLSAIVQHLRDHVTEIVDEARAGVLATFPDITGPGGGLYPELRAEACWRDFWHFLRCITYGIAGQHTDYTSAEGLGYMKQLYQELQVPLDAMVVGLEGIKIASLKRVEPEYQAELIPYFEHLMTELRRF
jgi:Phycobilisome protein